MGFALGPSWLQFRPIQVFRDVSWYIPFLQEPNIERMPPGPVRDAIWPPLPFDLELP